MKPRTILSIALNFLLIGLVGSNYINGIQTDNNSSLEPKTADKPILLLQTTTSMDATGLLDLIEPTFEAEYGYDLRWNAVGTGTALTNAGNGDGDVVIVHSKNDEYEFINHSSTLKSYSGKGVMRATFAFNFFIIVGPTDDLAGVGDADSFTNATKAFQKIYATAELGNAIFASRGDNSGTHSKEMSLWGAANLDPYAKSWYDSLGQGMAETLTYANNQEAYTLTDTATWLVMRDTLTNLKVLTGTAPDLKNTYSIIAVDPDKFTPGVIEFEGGKSLIHFMLTTGQQIIKSYNISNESIFTEYPLYTDTCFCGSEKCEVENGILAEYVTQWHIDHPTGTTTKTNEPFVIDAFPKETLLMVICLSTFLLINRKRKFN